MSGEIDHDHIEKMTTCSKLRSGEFPPLQIKGVLVGLTKKLISSATLYHCLFPVFHSGKHSPSSISLTDFSLASFLVLNVGLSSPVEELFTSCLATEHLLDMFFEQFCQGVKRIIRSVSIYHDLYIEYLSAMKGFYDVKHVFHLSISLDKQEIFFICDAVACHLRLPTVTFF